MADIDLDALMEKSVRQGMTYLSQHSGSSVVFKLHDGFNFSEPSNQEAEALSTELDRGIGHSGFSFGIALKQVFARAKAELNGEIHYQDERGEECPIDPRSEKIPANTARIVLKL